MKNYMYFVVEGQHDAAVLGKILKLKGFHSVKYIEQVDAYWKRLIPEKYPHRGDLNKRMPVPLFYELEQISIAIHPCEGDSGLVETLNISFSNIDNPELLSSVALFRDVDNLTAEACFEVLKKSIGTELDDSIIKDKFLSLDGAGMVSNETPKVGVYIFPDNKNAGYLEDILLEGAEIIYPNLLYHANQYLNSIDVTYKSNWRNSSEKKVLVGCIANILKPGKSNQVSIQDNDWISQASIENKEIVGALNEFVSRLLA